MSLSIALSQIQQPSWWNNPAEPWKSNKPAREQSACLRKEIERRLIQAGQPIRMCDLAEQLGVSRMTVRNLGMQLIETGGFKRLKIDGISALTVATGEQS